MRGEYSHSVHSPHSPPAYDARYGPDRSLPPPPPPPPRLGPPPLPQLGEPIRRHSNQYDELSRTYNGYDHRDSPLKQDPSLDQRSQIDLIRPNSTGHHPMHHPRPDDRRPPYDHPSVSNGSLSATPQYMPPPPPQYPERPYYEPAMSEPPREQMGFPIEVGYSTTSSSSQKKRSARTTQACEACRHAKAKCTDPKPCQGCVEKQIECKYDPPPPKP